MRFALAAAVLLAVSPQRDLGEFGIGVQLVNAAGNALTDLRITETNGDGIHLSATTGTKIRGNGLRSNSNGIFMTNGSNDNLIVQNDVRERLRRHLPRAVEPATDSSATP